MFGSYQTLRCYLYAAKKNDTDISCSQLVGHHSILRHSTIAFYKPPTWSLSLEVALPSSPYLTGHLPHPIHDPIKIENWIVNPHHHSASLMTSILAFPKWGKIIGNNSDYSMCILSLPLFTSGKLKNAYLCLIVLSCLNFENKKHKQNKWDFLVILGLNFIQ